MVAIRNGDVDAKETAIVDSTAHALKFAGFQDMYFQDSFPDGYTVRPNPDLVNRPRYVRPESVEEVPEAGRPLEGEAFDRFVDAVSGQIAKSLDLKKKV
jgi:threonine synthase